MRLKEEEFAKLLSPKEPPLQKHLKIQPPGSKTFEKMTKTTSNYSLLFNACSLPKTLKKPGRVWWLIPVIPALWRPRREDQLRSGVQDQPCQHAGNNDSKAKQVVSKIKEETLNDKVEFLYCDLASMTSIRQFVQKFKMKKILLHVLINNAGVMMVPQRKTRDGFEEHFGLNYLGHFLLTNLLVDTLKESGSPGHSARVVTVSSATHYVAELNMDDLQSRPPMKERGLPSTQQSPQSWKELVAVTYTTRKRPSPSTSPTTRNCSSSCGLRVVR
ncbi:dehydrogenase/reductase SDR family member on chromosome X isoform X3 [Pan paniscus]|uniref:dehydrogenase/reductase SDR family member on chromosome X isoform X3 n=1 Tax=Pan paniscus TaxID=9597 RepID=UPI0030059D5B